MPYLVGDLIEEINAGGLVPSFPKSFMGPPKLEKEQETIAMDEKKSTAAQKSRTTKSQEECQEDWVKNKWTWYYELNKMGEIKPNFSKMTCTQFEQYMKDAQAQGRHRVAAALRHIGPRENSVLQQEEAVKTVPISAATEDLRERKAVAPAADPQSVSVNNEPCPRKKPRVKALIIKRK